MSIKKIVKLPAHEQAARRARATVSLAPKPAPIVKPKPKAQLIGRFNPIPGHVTVVEHATPARIRVTRSN